MCSFKVQFNKKKYKNAPYLIFMQNYHKQQQQQMTELFISPSSPFSYVNEKHMFFFFLKYDINVIFWQHVCILNKIFRGLLLFGWINSFLNIAQKSDLESKLWSFYEHIRIFSPLPNIVCFSFSSKALIFLFYWRQQDVFQFLE